MTLQAIEFIRRFLLHVLPTGFVRIRHYGFLANRICREKLEQCRALLNVAMEPEASRPDPPENPEGTPAVVVCPLCGQGSMVVIETVRASRIATEAQGKAPALGRPAFDTS